MRFGMDRLNLIVTERWDLVVTEFRDTLREATGRRSPALTREPE